MIIQVTGPGQISVWKHACGGWDLASRYISMHAAAAGTYYMHHVRTLVPAISNNASSPRPWLVPQKICKIF